jgi:hypothetical protein
MKLKEDGVGVGAPTNSVAAGGVASLTGDPPVSVKTQRKIQKRQKSTPTSVILGYFRRKAPVIAEETFAGAVVFEVSSHTFHNAKMEKRKGKHWRTYLDECDELSEIREYANKHPKRPIVLQNRNTNEMVYVRYGKGR